MDDAKILFVLIVLASLLPIIIKVIFTFAFYYEFYVMTYRWSSELEKYIFIKKKGFKCIAKAEEEAARLRIYYELSGEKHKIVVEHNPV